MPVTSAPVETPAEWAVWGKPRGYLLARLATTGRRVLRLGTTVTGEAESLRAEPTRRLLASATACQTSPRRNYVYAHCDEHGVPFYIGRGTHSTAWDDDGRHPLWYRFVQKYLHGNFKVVVLADNLSVDEADELKGAWIAQESETLVNWINFSRKTDYAACNRSSTIRKAYWEFSFAARDCEKVDPAQAIRLYYRALEALAGYKTIRTEGGFIGRLLDEWSQETGYTGDLGTLDRLTLCLVRLGRGVEAGEIVRHYFEMFRADEHNRKAEPIKRRVAKAVNGPKKMPHSAT